MRILLVEAGVEYPHSYVPSATGVHIGLLLLAANLRAQHRSHDIRFESMQIHRALSDNFSLESAIAGWKPDIVGISSITSTFPEAIRIAHVARAAGCIVIIGGIFPSLNSDAIIQHYPDIDIIVRGDGEQTFCKLVDTLNTGCDLCEVLGITYREQGRVRSTPNRVPVDLNQMPAPAFDLAPMDVIRRLGLYVFVETARGCTFNCKFCSVIDEQLGGRRLRLKTAEQVVAELKLLRNLGVLRIQITDDTFTLNHVHTKAICEALEIADLGLEINALTRVDLVDRELLELMYRAGIRGIIFGIESGSENTLKAMNKGKKLARYRNVARDAVIMAVDTGFRVHPVFMLGWPGETWADIETTVDFAMQIGHAKLIQPFESFPTPHPGSEFWRQAKQLGLEMLTYDLSNYTHLCPVAMPKSLGGLDGLERLVEAHNTIHAATGMTYRTPLLDMSYIRSYIDVGDPQRETLWYNIDNAS